MEKKDKIKTHHRKYDDQFKQGALQQVGNGRSVSSVAQALGISEALLYQWRKRHSQGTSPNQNVELDALRKQVKQLEMERDILKKALTIFSHLKAIHGWPYSKSWKTDMPKNLSSSPRSSPSKIGLNISTNLRWPMPLWTDCQLMPTK